WTKGNEKGAGIYNGDIGTIVQVKKSDNSLVIDFDGRVAEYPYDFLEELELAYAVTVHKSQGSEFTAVVIPLLEGFDKLCYRNLLYTAVTRAKKLLIIVGSRSVVDRMVENCRKNLRYSCLKHFIEVECGGGKEQ
ncbi:MAG: ATP-dependent RecD-like DNA helicase, partial [Oscillospiraceae bacterium]|nr:ATP-dependent RecD-like DNA helicase [Oscillospiraceae bacterium]